MRKQRIFPAALLLCLCIALPATAQTSDVPVTTIIEGNGVGTSPTLHIQSDLAGAYKNSKTVQSVIQSIGDWVLNTASSSRSTRKALVDFRDPVSDSGPNGGAPVAPFAHQQVQARFISKCAEYGNSMFTLAGGMTMNCPLVVRFNYGGSEYRIQMNPVNYSETNYVDITCTGTNAASQCNQWRIEPSAIQADGQRKNVAKLVRLVTSKGKTIEENLGDFYLSFVINVTNP